MEKTNPEILSQGEIKCKKCGAKLKYAPGTDSIVCPYCGTKNKIEVDQQKLAEALKEIDYFEFIQNIDIAEEENEEQSVVKCPTCGATTSISTNIISSECPYCGSPLIKDQNQIKKQLKPSALIPFVITKNEASEKFNKWIKKSFWVPKKAKKYARPEKLQGLYTPYWTFDAKTITDYTGQRGDDYEETETYTNSEGETETRTVTRTEWTNVSGRVYVDFDDLLVVASNSLPQDHIRNLEPWDLSKLVPFDKKYMSGLKAESYTKDIQKGFDEAKIIMSINIEYEIRKDIGGDHQRIDSKNTTYNDVTFKHVLLPIWISSYRFKNKIYRFVVNGESGKIEGERPVSVLKIILVILLIAAIIALIFIFSQSK